MFCCMSDCVWNNMGFLTAGVFDADKAKTAIAALAADKPAWTTTVN